MTKKNALIISKASLLLVAFGFFMPFAVDRNVFKLINVLSRTASLLGIDISFYIFLIYLIFISSIVGVVMGYFLLTGKSMKPIFDWSPVIIANGSFLILIIRLINLANEASSGYGHRSLEISDFTEDLQIGAYSIIIGLISSLIFMVVASYTSENQNIKSGTTKKCPFCANDVKSEAIVCQFCGKDLPNYPPEGDSVLMNNLVISKPNFLLLASIIAPAIWLINKIYDISDFGSYAKEIGLSWSQLAEQTGFSWTRFWAWGIGILVLLAIPAILNILGQKKNNRIMILAAGIVNVLACIYFIYDSRNYLFYFRPYRLFIYFRLLAIILSAVLCFIWFKKTKNQNSALAVNIGAENISDIPSPEQVAEDTIAKSSVSYESVKNSAYSGTATEKDIANAKKKSKIAIIIIPIAAILVAAGIVCFYLLSQKNTDKQAAEISQSVVIEQEKPQPTEPEPPQPPPVSNQIIFPSSFIGTWKRAEFNNTLTATGNTIVISSRTHTWELLGVSGDIYTLKRPGADRFDIIIRLTNNGLVISGDTGTGQENWNGTWIKQ